MDLSRWMLGKCPRSATLHDNSWAVDPDPNGSDNNNNSKKKENTQDGTTIEQCKYSSNYASQLKLATVTAAVARCVAPVWPDDTSLIHATWRKGNNDDRSFRFFRAFQFCAALPISHSTNYRQLFNYIRQRHPLDEDSLRNLRFMDNWMIHIITTIMQQVNLESCGYLTSYLFGYWITSSSSVSCSVFFVFSC